MSNYLMLLPGLQRAMKQMNLRQVDLIPVMGGKNRVSEILNRKRRLTVAMIRNLGEYMHLSPSLLIQDYPLTGKDPG